MYALFVQDFNKIVFQILFVYGITCTRV